MYHVLKGKGSVQLLWYFACWCCKAARGSKRGPAAWTRLIMHVPNIWVVISTLRARVPEPALYFTTKLPFGITLLCCYCLLILSVIRYGFGWNCGKWCRAFPPRFNNNNNNYILGYMTKIRRKSFRSDFKTQYKPRKLYVFMYIYIFYL